MHEILTRELVRALRGGHSQRLLSRRLGFNANVLYLWESGRRCPSLLHFLALARRVGRLGPPISEFLGAHPVELDTGRGVGQVMRRLKGQLSTKEIATTLGTDRTTISRWLHGKTVPQTPAFFAFIELTTRRLLDFVALFADPAELDSTREAFVALMAQRELAYADPYSHAVLRALELDEIGRARHEPGVIARKLGITVEVERAALARLAKAKQITRRKGRYRIRQILPVDTRNDPEANLRLKQHWLHVAAERLDKTRAQGAGLYSYNLFAVGPHGFDQIRKLHVDYFERLRKIVNEEQGGDRVVLAAMQLVPLDE